LQLVNLIQILFIYLISD